MEHHEHVLVHAASERRFVERYGGLARMHGFPSTLGHVFALLLLSPAALTAEDLACRLGVSRSSAHGSARHLERLGVVERATEAGERLTHYRIRSGGLASMMEDILHKLRAGRDFAAETLHDWDAGDPMVRERLESLYRIQASAIAAVEEALGRHGSSRSSERPGHADPEPPVYTVGHPVSIEKPHEET